MTARQNRQAGTLQLSDNAALVLERRYLARNEQGEPTETPEQLFRRVAHNISQAELAYNPALQQPSREIVDNPARVVEDRFFDLMQRLDFLPNSPTLMNAGRDIQQLSACFVIPVPDSIEGIFGAIRDTAVIHQSGGGTGFAFSRLRPRGDIVRSTMGVASGPVSFLKVFDAATEAIKQGGTRRGANMGILAVTHPDIDEFIALKSDMRTLTNFNISVAVTEAFMSAVEADEEYDLINPRTGAAVGRRRARPVFEALVDNAWQNGDPGIVFIDRINRDNPTPQLGEIEATNPCGEQPLLPYESCNLGSLNLGHFVTAAKQPRLDWERLATVIPDCVRFLDNVIDMNRYPVDEIDAATRQTRKIGLGLMGWHDALMQLGIAYDSEDALALAEELGRFVQEKANEASLQLAEERGAFPAFEGSRYDPDSPYRNATRTTIAPTGTLSIIADCSSGIEPVFALAYTRQHYLDPTDPTKLTRMTEVNKYFLEAARRGGYLSDDLIDHLAEGGTLQDRPEVPDDARRVFRSAHEITPEWHVRMQAAFQRYTDNAVSKTINFPFEATREDVATAFRLAYTEGCKGITIYREGSRNFSVLSHGAVNVPGPEQETAEALREIAGTLRDLPVRSPLREFLPDERQSITHKFRVGDQEGYLTVGLYPDGRPGELFVKINKEGSMVSGLMDAVAKIASIALQFGVPLSELAPKMRNTRFEPYGPTGNPDIPWATSIVDYVFHWLQRKFATDEDGSHSGSTAANEPSGIGCPDCGSVLAYQEGCLVCRSCGYNRCG
jgi:ribonucleoside-diphosphate reductase alpha chain